MILVGYKCSDIWYCYVYNVIYISDTVYTITRVSKLKLKYHIVMFNNLSDKYQMKSILYWSDDLDRIIVFTKISDIFGYISDILHTIIRVGKL